MRTANCRPAAAASIGPGAGIGTREGGRTAGVHANHGQDSPNERRGCVQCGVMSGALRARMASSRHGDAVAGDGWHGPLTARSLCSAVHAACMHALVASDSACGRGPTTSPCTSSALAPTEYPATGVRQSCSSGSPTACIPVRNTPTLAARCLVRSPRTPLASHHRTHTGPRFSPGHKVRARLPRHRTPIVSTYTRKAKYYMS